MVIGHYISQEGLHRTPYQLHVLENLSDILQQFVLQVGI